jgi:hypothetical protein
MVKTRSFKAPGRRLLFASVALVLGTLVAAAPASAKPTHWKAAVAGPSASNQITMVPSVWYPDSPCTFDVEYHWIGFAGKNLTASVHLVDSTGANIAAAQVGPVTGDGWVMFFFKFGGTVGAPRDIYARGSLVSGGVEDPTSVVTSAPLNNACGGAYGVGSPTVIPLI